MLPETFTPEFLKQIEKLKIHSRRAFLGSRQGGHSSLKKGHGMEFADYRKYEPGDDPRHIDWGVYARSDRLYVKQFREEQDLTVLVMLDASASMGVVENDRKWQMARDIALTLAYVALMEQDTISVSVLGKYFGSNFSGGKAFHLIAKALTEHHPQGQLAFSGEISHSVARIRFPGKAILISDFLMPFSEIQQAIHTVQAKNLDLTCIQVLGDSDITPLKDMEQAVALDSETGEEVPLALDPELREEYDYLLFRHNEKLRNYLNQRQVSFTQTISSRSLTDFVINNLTYIGLLK